MLSLQPCHASSLQSPQILTTGFRTKELYGASCYYEIQTARCASLLSSVSAWAAARYLIDLLTPPLPTMVSFFWRIPWYALFNSGRYKYGSKNIAGATIFSGLSLLMGSDSSQNPSNKENLRDLAESCPALSLWKKNPSRCIMAIA
jgi:hypothetical protein